MFGFLTRVFRCLFHGEPLFKSGYGVELVQHKDRTEVVGYLYPTWPVRLDRQEIYRVAVDKETFIRFVHLLKPKEASTREKDRILFFTFKPKRQAA